MALALSVLDFIPIRSDRTTADAVAASLKLARVADEPGYERYRVAEHHSSPFASTNPPVVVGMIASRTERKGRLRRCNAAEPCPVRGGGAVRAAGGGLSGPDRSRPRPGARR
ncbi:LLM class flavin-dependent oxidoreductase [Streptomyces coacervatus]